MEYEVWLINVGVNLSPSEAIRKLKNRFNVKDAEKVYKNWRKEYIKARV